MGCDLLCIHEEQLHYSEVVLQCKLDSPHRNPCIDEDSLLSRPGREAPEEKLMRRYAKVLVIRYVKDLGSELQVVGFAEPERLVE